MAASVLGHSGDALSSRLMRHAAELSIVDSHQHLGPEAPVRTDLCRHWVEDNYLLTDLMAAGLRPEEAKRLADVSLPLPERWAVGEPFWRSVRHGSYARAYHLTFRDLFGVHSLDATTFETVSDRLSREYATPGLYRRVLFERCRIDTVLTQGAAFDYASPRFHYVASFVGLFDFRPGGAFDQAARSVGVALRTVDDVAEAMDALIRKRRAEGAVGFKTVALSWREPSREALEVAFRRCWHEHLTSPDPNAITPEAPQFPLVCLCVSRIAAAAREFDVPLALHTGAPWSSWLNFPAWEPTGLIPLLSTFRDTRFELYHAGFPYGPQTSMLAKAFPNVWLNLTWAHLISPTLVCRALEEWLDMVPVNKVIAFGGDYLPSTVLLTYGHLVLARKHIVTVLARLVRRGMLSESDAIDILQAWFSENPRRLYRLPPPPG